MNNCVPMLLLLINNGANVNIKADSSFGETPLHICCKFGNNNINNNNNKYNTNYNNSYNNYYYFDIILLL